MANGARQALETPFGNQPAQVANPVPNEQQTKNIFAELEDMAPDVELSPDRPGQEDQAGQADTTMTQDLATTQAQARASAQQGTVFEELVPTEELPREPEQSFVEQQLPNRELVEARLVAAIPKTFNEKQQALQNFLGSKNVRVEKRDGEDEFLIRLPGKKGFQQLDPDTFEFFNDMFVDQAREAFIGGGAALGAAAATAAQGPLAAEPVSTAVGGAAGFVGGAAAGEITADQIAEQFLGVERDPSRGGVVREGEGVGSRVQAGIERSLESIQTGVSTLLFQKVGDKLFKGIGNRIAARRSRSEAIKKAKEIPEHVTLSETVQDNIDTISELNKLGKLENLPGTDTPLLAHQVLPGVRGAEQIAESLQGNKQFIALQDQASKQMGETLLDVVETAADLSGGSLKKVVREGVKKDRTGLAGQAKDLLEKSIRAEGQLIEKFRNKAKTVASKAALPSPRLEQALLDTFQDLEVRRRGGEIIFPDDDTMAQLLGTDSPAIIRGLKGDITRLSEKLATKGGMTIDELIGQSKLIGAKNNAAGRIGGQYKKIIGRLSSELRKDSREAMPLILDESDAIAYNQSMDKFRSFAQSRDQLKNLLQDDMGANTFTRLLLSKGKNGLPNLKAAKEFMLKEDPQVWNNVVGEFFEELAIKHRKAGDPSKIEYNIEGMRKELAGFGKEFLDEMFAPGSGVDTKTVLKTFDLAQQVKNAGLKGTESELKRAAKETIKSFSGFALAPINMTAAVMNTLGENKRLIKLISRDGVEEFLELVPTKKRGPIRKTLNRLVDYAKQQGMIVGREISEVKQAEELQRFTQRMSQIPGFDQAAQPEPPRR